MLRTTLVALAAVLLFGTAARAQVVTRFEDFATNPGWTLFNNGSGGSSFGYQASNHAGGSPGEAGGHFTRANSFRYYADTNLNGPLNLNHPLSASGRFDFTSVNTPDFNNGLFIGHFQSAVENYTIGLFFSNGGGNTAKLAWGINVRGDSFNILSSQSSLDPNIDRTWSYAWDPTGGANGVGRLTATLSGPGGGTKTVDMPAGASIRADAHFEAFGINATNVGATSSPAQNADLYFDDLSYSVLAVPEPSSLALLTLGVAGAWRFRRIRNRN